MSISAEVFPGNRGINRHGVYELYDVPIGIGNNNILLETLAGEGRFTFADSDRLTGDSLDAPLTWNGAPDTTRAGESFAIRIRMFQAKVFGYAC